VPFSASVLRGDSFPPSKGRFNETMLPHMMPCIEAMHERSSPFSVNLYPYISYLNVKEISLEYATFALKDHGEGCFDDLAGTYCNLFDGSYDTVRYALDAINYTTMELEVGESGWPTDGGAAGPFSREGADIATGCRFVNEQLNSVQSLLTPYLRQIMKEDPKRFPDLPIDGIDLYLFEAFDESLKDTAGGAIPYEPYWGVWKEDGSYKFDVDWNGTVGYSAVC